MPNYLNFNILQCFKIKYNHERKKNLSTSQRIIIGVWFFSYFHPLIYFITNLSVMIFTVFYLKDTEIFNDAGCV